MLHMLEYENKLYSSFHQVIDYTEARFPFNVEKHFFRVNDNLLVRYLKWETLLPVVKWVELDTTT